MSYSIRIKKNSVKDVAPKRGFIWVAVNKDFYVKKSDRTIFETLEAAQSIKLWSVEEIIINE
jgi:hypothetical protein